MQDFEDYQENDEILEIQKEFEMKEKLIELKLNLARENYYMIMDNGMDIESMKRTGIDLSPVQETLSQMLDIFEEIEEYEKCAKLKEYIQQIEEYII